MITSSYCVVKKKNWRHKSYHPASLTSGGNPHKKLKKPFFEPIINYLNKQKPNILWRRNYVMNLMFNLSKNVHPTLTLTPSKWDLNITTSWGKKIVKKGGEPPFRGFQQTPRIQKQFKQQRLLRVVCLNQFSKKTIKT